MDQSVLLMLVLLGALVTVPVPPFVPNVDVPPGIVLPLLLPPLPAPLLPPCCTRPSSAPRGGSSRRAGSRSSCSPWRSSS
ncbi:hypothetical protein GCM10009733_106930 [Nonomuraea maheshkhaliensis]|uniref:Secreted peptide n=1 Tax=Nonomuraea maheshkhaliensis TaxID=419590 RepID=A0ABP4TTW7_9ACTN